MDIGTKIEELGLSPSNSFNFYAALRKELLSKWSKRSLYDVLKPVITHFDSATGVSPWVSIPNFIDEMKQLTDLVPGKKLSTKLDQLLRFFPELKPGMINRLPYMPQLDGLRAFAVTAVLIHHYISGGWILGATLGVKLFFVLSGFLITSILIRSRNKADVLNKSNFGALKSFYIRRSLRIFPLYYFVVVVGALVNVGMVREYLPFFLTYTLNIKMAQQG